MCDLRSLSLESYAVAAVVVCMQKGGLGLIYVFLLCIPPGVRCWTASLTAKRSATRSNTPRSRVAAVTVVVVVVPGWVATAGSHSRYTVFEYNNNYVAGSHPRCTAFEYNNNYVAGSHPPPLDCYYIVIYSKSGIVNNAVRAT